MYSSAPADDAIAAFDQILRDRHADFADPYNTNRYHSSRAPLRHVDGLIGQVDPQAEHCLQ